MTVELLEKYVYLCVLLQNNRSKSVSHDVREGERNIVSEPDNTLNVPHNAFENVYNNQNTSY